MPDLQLSLPPNTTAQQDLIVDNQRKINLIWEHTQASIACFVVIITLVASFWQIVVGKVGEVPTIMAVAFGTVVGFYFGRTNHSRPEGK